MKNRFTLLLLLTLFVLTGTACNRNAYCPAYNSTQTSRNYNDNPNRSSNKKNNKKDVAQRRKADMKMPKKRSKSYNLFPKGMR